MKRSIKTFKSGLAVIAVTLLLVSPVLGQRSVEKLSGYVNLERIGHLDDYFERQATIEVNVEGPLMRLVAAASRFEDPELADLLLKLDGVFVRGFELERSDRDAFEESASRIGDYLEDEGWSVVVKVRNRDEIVHMYVNMEDDTVVGIVVMSMEGGGDETVFVNIVGEMDPEQIGSIGRKFHIGGVRDWN